MQQKSHDHKVFMGRTMELPSLRSTLLDQNRSNAALTVELTRSPNIQFISIEQQIEEVSVKRNSTITESSTGTHTEQSGSSTRNNQVQETSQDDEVFIREHSELISLRRATVEKRHFTSALNQQLNGTTEIRIVQQLEKVSVIHNSTTTRPSPTHEETGDTHILTYGDVRRHQSQPRKPCALSERGKGKSRNRGNSAEFTDSSTHDNSLRPKCNVIGDPLLTDDTQIVSSDDEEQHQPLLRPLHSQSKQSGSSTRKKQARKSSWNCGSSANDHARSQFRTGETFCISSDDKKHDHVPDPPLSRRPNVKQLESLKRNKQIISVSQCKPSDCNKRDHGKECARQVKSSNESPKSSLNIRKESITYICAECNKRFSVKQNLDVHLRRIHSGKMPYECKTCKRSFTQKHCLTRHLMIHSGEKPFECNTCNRTFNRKSNLTMHLRLHTSEKPFECKTCKRTFTTSNSLTRHLRIHSGVKPYECQTCWRTFNVKFNLTRHLRIHSGERPYRCKICNRTFNQSSILKKHLETHRT